MTTGVGRHVREVVISHDRLETTLNPCFFFFFTSCFIHVYSISLIPRRTRKSSYVLTQLLQCMPVACEEHFLFETAHKNYHTLLTGMARGDT